MSRHYIISPIDSFTEAGARELCQRITAYWHGRGYRVSAQPALKTVETMDWRGCKSRSIYWAVTSDIGMYMPPKAIGSS